MKKAKVDEVWERAGVINSICITLQKSFSHKALVNRLSPIEMMSVAAAFSYTLISEICKYFELDKEAIMERFLTVLKEMAEDDKMIDDIK